MKRGDWAFIALQLVIWTVANLMVWLWLAPVYIRWAVQQP